MARRRPRERVSFRYELVTLLFGAVGFGFLWLAFQMGWLAALSEWMVGLLKPK